MRCRFEDCLDLGIAKNLCVRHYGFVSYQANKEHKREVKRQWVDKNRDYVRQLKRKSHYKRQFGLTLEQYNQLLIDQNNQCKICKSTNPKSKRKTGFQVDHCHITGKIRGLLCVPCNLAIGHFQDNPEIMVTAAEYVKDHQS